MLRKDSEYRDVHPLCITRVGKSLRTIRWRDGGSVQTKSRFMFYVLIDLFTIFKIKRWQKQCMRNKFLIYNVLSKLAVAFILIIIIPINGGDSPWAGHLEPCKVKKCWDQPSPTAPDSPCRPGGAALVPPGLLYLEGESGLLTSLQHLMIQAALPSPAPGFWWWWLPSDTPTQEKHPNLPGNLFLNLKPFFFSPVEFWSRAVVLAPGMTSCMSLGSFWLSKH